MIDTCPQFTPQQATDFCRPPEVAAIQRVLARVADLSITAHGGFPQAERRRVFFARAMEDYGGGEGGGGGEGDEKVPEELLPYFQVGGMGRGMDGVCVDAPRLDAHNTIRNADVDVQTHRR